MNDETNQGGLTAQGDAWTEDDRLRAQVAYATAQTDREGPAVSQALAEYFQTQERAKVQAHSYAEERKAPLRDKAIEVLGRDFVTTYIDNPEIYNDGDRIYAAMFMKRGTLRPFEFCIDEEDGALLGRAELGQGYTTITSLADVGRAIQKPAKKVVTKTDYGSQSAYPFDSVTGAGGMSLRQHYAGLVFASFTTPGPFAKPEHVLKAAEDAVQYANLLLRALEEDAKNR